MREKLIELLKTIPQVNHAQAAVEGIDYVFWCAADYLLANGVVVREKGEWEPVLDKLGEHREEEVFARVWRCPVCGEEQFYGNFCYECGADMRAAKEVKR